MASTEEVEQRLGELIARLGESDQAVAAVGRSLPDPRTLALHITDLDAQYWTELVDGRLGPLQRGEREQAHIRIAMSSDDLVEMIDGGRSFAGAYMSGRIRVEASFADLMKLRRLA